jgi:hypothetical protein
VDRENVFQTPQPEVPAHDPEPTSGTTMPAPATDPADATTAPMGGDVPPMTTPRMARRFDAWTYPQDTGIGDGADLVGYRIEAIDGHIGKVDQTSTLVGEQYLVVDTGPWIFGRKVLLPAGTVNHVDPLDEKVYVDRTKTQIKDAPQFDPETYQSAEYRGQVGNYYHGTYRDRS